MKYPVYNQKGEKAGTTLLPKELFGVPLNKDLVHQVVVCQMANKRQGTAHTKTRDEVSGGGKKPWRQKGTGRARHGSTRSPIWRGGGIAFGPRKNKVYKKRIPKKMKRKALFMVLSEKTKEDLLLILDELKIEKPKTKLMVAVIEALTSKAEGFEKKSTLLVLPRKEAIIIRASRNIPALQVIEARELNALGLLSFKYLILPKESINVIKETFLTSNVKTQNSKLKTTTLNVKSNKLSNKE